MVVGIDEVGRGPWAGPLVIGAVILGETEIVGLTDSKKLSKKRREVLSQEIHASASAIGLGWVSASELDAVGMSQALTLGCRRALEQITAPYHQIIIDGTVNLLKDTGKGPFVTTMKQADLLVPSVSAASIVAKVARDDFMAHQDEIYPGYGFAANAGYGTALHRSAIDKLGVTPLHRLSFAPLATYRTDQPATNPSVKTSGEKGEDAAVDYLKRSGYAILARNWRTKFCEIDIVAQKGDTVRFVEVKYRRNSVQGGGLAAITATKLDHMDRAARAWLQRNPALATKASLAVIEVSGNSFEVTNFLEQVQT